MIYSILTFLNLELLRARFEVKEELKKELSEKISTQSMPTFLANMTKILEQNGGNYLVGNAVGIYIYFKLVSNNGNLTVAIKKS